MKFYLIIIFGIISIVCPAQTIKYKELDSLSYLYFNDKNINKHEELKLEAIRNDLDCYTLRLRLGILYFNNKSYIKAKEEFNYALRFNSYDSLIFEYLYYCDVFLTKTAEADLNTFNYPKSLNKRLGIKNQILISDVTIEGGYYTNSENQINLPTSLNTIGSTPPQPPKPGTQAPMYYRIIEQTKNLDMSFANLSITTKASPKLYFTNSFGQYQLNKEQVYKANSSEYKFNYMLTQTDYSIYTRYLLNNKYSLGFSYHYCGLKNTEYSPVFDQTKRFYSFNATNVKEVNHLFHSSIRINNKKGWFEPAYSFSSINKTSVHQFSGGFKYFPTLKNNIYMYTSASIVKSNNTSSHLVLNQKAGIIANKYFSAEGVVYLGRLMNYNENNGQLLYNLADDIKVKLGLNLYFNITRNLQFNIYSSMLYRENYYKTRNMLNEENTIINNYKQYTLTGGITWKF